MRSGRVRLVGLLGAQVVVLGGIAAYLLFGGAAKPDSGLRQLDLLYLDQRVAGVAGVAGHPTMIVVTGNPGGGACYDQVLAAARMRGLPEGLDPAYPLVVLVAADRVPPALADLPGLLVRPDPGGAIAERLALAAPGCRPGYALVDPAGLVRYRTFDPDWAAHSQEQEILLGDLR